MAFSTVIWLAIADGMLAMDPEVMSAAAKRLTFAVRFGDPQNGQDPLPFSTLVGVVCEPADTPARLAQLTCRERGR